jgi:hypothetical protein
VGEGVEKMVCKAGSEQLAPEHLAGHVAARLAIYHQAGSVSIKKGGYCHYDAKWGFVWGPALWGALKDELFVIIAGPLVEWGLRRSDLELHHITCGQGEIRNKIRNMLDQGLRQDSWESWVRKTKGLLQRQRTPQVIEALVVALRARMSLNEYEIEKISKRVR